MSRLSSNPLATRPLLAAFALCFACSEVPSTDTSAPPEAPSAPEASAPTDHEALEARAPIELPALEVQRPAPAEQDPRPANTFWGVTDPAPPTASPAASRYKVEVHALWFEGECPGEGRKTSAGISLVMRGRLTNPSGLRLHRATLTGTLFARFSAKAAHLKASRSRGFKEEVTSDAIWEPGTSRDFELKTQPLDPAYCDYPAQEALAAVELEAEDPLGERIEETVHVQLVDWHTVQGASRDLTATLHTDTRSAGPYLLPRARANEAVRVVHVRRDQALVVGPDGAVGLVPLSALRASPAPLSAQPRCEPKPAVLRVGDLELTVDAVRESTPSLLTGRATLRNLTERPVRCGALDLRVLLANAKDLRANLSPELLDACRQGLPPGEVASGTITATLPPLQEAIAIGIFRGPAAPLCGIRRAPDSK